jgi:hypothetical protein
VPSRPTRSGLTLALTVLPLVLLGTAGLARAQDVISIRGKYYKEASTRVLQPTVDISKDLTEKDNLGVHFLLDAITSASVAAGVNTDQPFTEYRTEIGVRYRRRFNSDSTLTSFYRFSDESDYRSNAVGTAYTHELWAKTIKLGLSLAYSFDQNDARRNGRLDNPHGDLNVVTLSPSYSQVLSRTTVLFANYEIAILRGFQQNPYRTVAIEGQPNAVFENHPQSRDRHALGAGVRQFVPRTRTTLGLGYRFYIDTWDIKSHSVEARIYQQLHPDLEARFTYRYYTQTASFFAPAFEVDPLTGVRNPQPYSPICPPGMAQPANKSCSVYYTADPKMTAFDTHYPELRLVWRLTGLRTITRSLGNSTLDASYGYLVQHNQYGDAHVAQIGFTWPY